MGYHDDSPSSPGVSKEEIEPFLEEYELKSEFDVEKQHSAHPRRESSLGLALWIALNILATIGIVS